MKIIKSLAVAALTIATTLTLTGCGNNSNVITVCASELPHADVLENCVKDILAEEGYKLEVTILDWSVQNQAVAAGDYDANYFQHVPYLQGDESASSLFAACKVHYEPLGIYRGKSTGNLEDGKSFEICNDTSNAIRAFQLLKEKGILNEIPVNETGDQLTMTGSKYTEGDITVTLIAENLLVTSLNDYDFGLLPCNTAYTGNVSKDKQVAKEDNPDQVSLKANIIAARKDDYLNDEDYKKKIDVLVEALLSDSVSQYFDNAYNGTMTCDSSSQIDLRSLLN